MKNLANTLCLLLVICACGCRIRYESHPTNPETEPGWRLDPHNPLEKPAGVERDGQQ